MANIQKALEALQPYVIGIRYIDGGVAVVDAVFKDGWTLPESDIVKRAKGNEEMNYYMLFSEKDGVGIDELLDYVGLTIKANIEREKKHELLKEMVNELKIIFKKNSLINLKRLRFVFGEEDITPDLNEFDLDEPMVDIPEEKIAQPIEIKTPEFPATDVEREYYPEEPMTDEDREILEEEKRAANFFKLKEAEKLNGLTTKINTKVELPPKGRIQQATSDIDLDSDCECGPEEACNKCIEKKGF